MQMVAGGIVLRLVCNMLRSWCAVIKTGRLGWVAHGQVNPVPSRCFSNPYGDTACQKVRLSNLIAENTVAG